MAVDGTYNIEMETPLGRQEAVLKLAAAGEKLAGSIEASLGKADFTGTVNGNDLFCSVEVSSPMGKVKLDINGTVSGGAISGSVKAGSFGTLTFKGKKI